MLIKCVYIYFGGIHFSLCRWICHIHHQPCHVIYTDYRPTPLQHYIFPAGGDGLHLVVDDKRRFRDENFQKALATLTEGKEESGGQIKHKSQGKGNKSDIFRIVKLIMNRHYDPCLIFCFSKRDCEANALQMSKLDLNSDDEKALVEEVFNNAIDSLGDEDKKLPQVENLLPLLKRGIGLHHSGLLPILKEVCFVLQSEYILGFDIEFDYHFVYFFNFFWNASRSWRFSSKKG
jgi:ATP-dependent RNA helicase DOB1